MNKKEETVVIVALCVAASSMLILIALLTSILFKDECAKDTELSKWTICIRKIEKEGE